MATETRPEVAVEPYNYPAFAQSTALGQSAVFRGTLRVGDQAPDFALAALDGSTVRLGDLRGKYVVLEFGSIT